MNELDETGLRHRHSIVKVLEPEDSHQIRRILDVKKEYLLSHTL